MSDIIVPYIAVVIVFLALGIIAQTVILLRLAPTGSIRTFFSSFRFHYPRIVAFRYRAILHPRHGLVNRRVLIVGAHEIGFNHYAIHRPYPIGSRIWIYLARLNRDIPAIVINFNKSSQSYLVDLDGGRTTSVMFASSVLGYVSDADWLRFGWGGAEAVV